MIRALIAILLLGANLCAAGDIRDAARKLGRGVNFGNTLEAPTEGAWGLTLKAEYFKAIKDAGFDSVRLPVKWSAHSTDMPPYAIDAKFFERIDWALDQAQKNQLNIVLNIHHFDGMDANPDKSEPKFLALWKQIAERYKERPSSVYFELLNEPHDKLTDARWNQVIGPALKVVRASNPTRPVIIGPGSWNGFRNLPKMELPKDDRNLIATFHYYEPFEFTHQGAEWAKGSDKWLGRKWSASGKDIEAVRAAFDSVKAWADKNDRPIYLGEFGAYNKADLESRIAWTRAVTTEAEKRGFTTAYWEFGSGFGLYDPAKGEWRKPLLDALGVGAWKPGR
jgi:endoglucanase